MVDEVFANRGVTVRQESDFQLRADAVGRADENGIAPAAKKEPAAKAADVGENGRVKGGTGMLADQADRAFPFVDIHAGIAVLYLGFF